ncbi:hypothetical protein OSB04_030582 [Centaurea solstitialis]|uniref:Uncharacterized protein n=1 Tax=Centaurea solstitialis TaxID=347529 RepID=A0AA38S924_9ASTR|nr:hypothetical protein OSB04_030582 [Centaurea solstitialis]
MASLHPAVTVTNIRNFIPIVLEMDDGQYTSWVELFKIHCRAHDVIHHIIPAEATPSEPAAEKGKDKADDAALQKRLDSIVLQWIYGTISKDLLITILKPNSTAAQAWKALENIFIDSKPSRALYLENKFNNVRLESFSNVSTYCQELKTLSDQLTNVDAPVSNDRLVLQLINGLGDKYESLATLLQQSTPLPDFYTARSKLILEETRKNQTSKISTDAAAALNTETTTATTDRRHQPPPTDQQYRSGGGRGQYDYSSRGRNNGRGGQGRGRGILGTNPYVNAAPGHSYTPTNIEQAMHTMTLNPDQNWITRRGFLSFDVTALETSIPSHYILIESHHLPPLQL